MDEPITTTEPVSAPTEPTAPSEPTSQAGGIPVSQEPVTPPVEPPVASQTQSVVPQMPATPPPSESKAPEPPKAQEAKSYEPFNIPEGFDVPADSFKQVAMQSGLSQEQAQAMINYYCKEVIPARTEAVKQQIASWRQETINQMGKQGMDMMNNLVNRISKTNPLFAPLLRDTGLCYHPVVVKAFVDLASHMSEGNQGVPMSTYQSPQEKRDIASLLFPNSLK